MSQGVRGIEEATKQIHTWLPLLIGVVFFVFVLVVALKIAFRFLMPAKKSSQNESAETMTVQSLKPGKVVAYPYGIRDEFLTPAELSFHHVLRSVLSSDATIAMKVRLSDLLFTRQPNSNQGAMNRIHMKHVDFVICETATMKPRLAIELDDATHGRSDRKERDEFVDEAFKAAGLPVLHVKAAHGYNPPQLFADIQKAITSA
jgi:very-short-patch-repair endonuclease